MKKKKLIISLCIIATVLLTGAFVVYAAAYDSTKDPLVALSYITNVFKPSVDKDIKAVSDKVASAEAKITALEKSLAGGTFDPSAIEGRLDVLESGIDSLEGTASSQNAEIEAMKAQLQSAEGEIQSAKKDLEDAKKELSALMSDNATKTQIAELTERINSQSERVDTLIGTYGALLDLLMAEREPTEENYGYKTVTLNSGEKVVCGSECIMMLRSGAGVYSFTGEGYDATGADLISSGDSAKAEHIVTFENGAVFTASEKAVIMVKGDYTVE